MQSVHINSSSDEVGVHDDVPVFEWGEGGEGLEAVYCKAYPFLFLPLKCARGCVVSDVTTHIIVVTKQNGQLSSTANTFNLLPLSPLLMWCTASSL